ncbi:MFS transporter [Herbiconiux moechotypicola]|uniref:Major facilitator superfamily (MFS) profile domain-containing protein n=1 Tax=Herbiconiux moechotypicola TaxID=637393 RepID=A0ABP5QF56_9MICO|nr:MFS transporter [Herbiconiux moechotypicola]MCS5729961.1 MFS transporter [Herbiconiux moechotypicola]
MNAQAILVCAFIASAQMTWGVIVPALPVLVEAFGIGAASIGLLIASFAIGRVLANVPAGLALRRIPPRPFLQVVSLLLAVVTALTGFLPTEPLLLGARLVAGVLGGAAVTIGFAVLVAGAPPARRGRTMATATVVQMSGSAIGALIGGAAVTAIGVQGAFVVAVVPLLACLAVDLVRPARYYWAAFSRARAATDARGAAAPDDRVDAATDARSGEAGEAPVATQAASRFGGSRALVIGLVAVSFATFLARFAGEQGLIPVLAYDVGGLTPLGLGVAMSVGTLVSIGALPLVGRLVDRGARLSVLIPASLVSAGSLLLFPVLPAPIAFSAVLVAYYVATSVAGVVPNVVTGERFSPAAAGAVVGFTRTAGDIGAAVGPLLVFALADQLGALPAVATIAAVLLAAVAVLAPTLTRPRASENPAPAR